MRLNAILGRFELWGEIWYWHFANKQILAVWRFIIFRQQEGMHLRVSLRETKKHPLKIPKISPKNLGRFAGCVEEWIIIYWELHEHVFDLSYVWKIQKILLLFSSKSISAILFQNPPFFHPQFLSAYIFFTSNIEYITFEWREIFLTAVINKYVIINCVFFLFFYWCSWCDLFRTES